MSQAESRVVYMLTGDPDMVNLARADTTFDQHTYNAAIIYNIPEAELAADIALKKIPKDKRTPEQKARLAVATEKRYFGKRSVHGAQRDMRGKRLSNTLLLDDFVVSPEECDRALERYHARFPSIREGYFKFIRRQVMRDKMLVNSWGRRLDFRYDRLDDELFRQAYSFIPQSEVADLLNQRGVIPVHLYVKSLTGRPPNIQVHDSLLISVEPEYAYDIAHFIRHSLEHPILLANETLVIPVEFKLGSTWEGDFEFKKLPSRAEFTEAAYEVDRKVKALRGE